MRTIAIVACVASLSIPQVSLRAQTTSSANVAGVWDRYSFDAGLMVEGLGELSTVSQFSVPFTVGMPLGSRASVLFSGGYTRVELTSENAGNVNQLVVDGPTDVEARFSVEVVPDRLTLFATGALPTGNETVEVAALPLLNVLVADVLSFSTRSLGTGGSGGVGLAAAVPMNRMALGVAGSYTQFGSFAPVAGQPEQLNPGGELRLRAGIQGPIALRTQLRIAAIFSRKSSDEIGSVSMSRVGNRLSGYISLDQAIGRSTITLYAFDAFRDAPQIEFTPLGPAALPRGNLLAGGAQATIALGARTNLIPRAELRRSDQATEPDSDELTKLGTSARFGVDLAVRMSPRASLVLEGEGLFGSVREGVFSPLAPVAASVGVTGFRLGTHLSIKR